MTDATFANKRILVVDDEERIVRFIRLNLEQDGFQVVEANTGKQAMEKLRQSLPDLMLLDVMLPDLDGFQVLRMVRENHDVPVIMLTAKTEEDDRVRGLELGADDYVTKPFSPRELVSRVRAVKARKASLRWMTASRSISTGVRFGWRVSRSSCALLSTVCSTTWCRMPAGL
jgi:two-component system KDP operon response regulator KdpE